MAMNHLFCHLIQSSVLPLIWPRGFFGLPWTKARKWRSFYMAPREWWAHVNYHYNVMMIHDDVFISREYSGWFDLPLMQYPYCPFGSHLGEDINEKKTLSFGHCPNEGGGSTNAQFFWLFSRSAFLVNKKSLFLQKCQCIELLTVFRLLIYLPPLP